MKKELLVGTIIIGIGAVLGGEIYVQNQQIQDLKSQVEGMNGQVDSHGREIDAQATRQVKGEKVQDKLIDADIETASALCKNVVFDLNTRGAGLDPDICDPLTERYKEHWRNVLKDIMDGGDGSIPTPIPNQTQ